MPDTPRRARAAEPAPAAVPWASGLLFVLLLLAVLVFWLEKSGSATFEEAALTGFVQGDPGTWYRLVAALFVHGRQHQFQALIVVGAVVYNAARSERALGAGALLVCFLAGGIAGNLARCLFESPALLVASAGTTSGALAVIGANTSILIRTRQKGFVAAIAGGLFSALFTTFFSAAQQLGTTFDRVPDMFPAAGSAFLVGGFVAAILPLYDPGRGRLLRALLLVLGLGTIGASGLAYVGHVRARWSSAPRRTDTPAPELERTWNRHLRRYDFGMPISHHCESDKDGVVRLTPNVGQLPQVVIASGAKDPSKSADIVAFELARMIRRENPNTKQLDEAWIEHCPLGAAYRSGLHVERPEGPLDYQLCVLDAGEESLEVLVFTTPDDPEAKALAEAICRSLKVHSASADKESGGRSK